MIIIEPSYELILPTFPQDMLKDVEKAGRTCYRSEDLITDDSAPKFVQMLINRGHEAMIEHASFSIKWITDRATLAEITRHRLCSFGVESSRYCCYAKDKFNNQITFIRPLWINDENNDNYDTANIVFTDTCEWAEENYLRLLKLGYKPEQARDILPNCLKTEIVMTANLREWRHFFKLRTANVAAPEMRRITRPALDELKQLIPIVFDDIEYSVKENS